MKIFRICYFAPQDVTNRDYDGKMIAFPLSVVPEEFVNTPEENAMTVKIRPVVRIDGSTVAAWQLAGNDLVRVAFHDVRKFIKEALEKETRFDSYTVDGPLISIHNTPRPTLVDPNRIPFPENFTETLEIQRGIGFAPS
jgi:hypothetical protein